jgi:Phosphotransferase enzyme family
MRSAVGDAGELAHLAWHQQPVLLQMCELLWPPPAELVLGRAGTTATPSTAADGSAADGAGTDGSADGASTDGGAGCPGSDFILVPGLRRPPLLVPADHRVAAAAVRHYSGQRSPAARLTTRLFSAALGSGLGSAMFRHRVTMHVPPGTDTIQTYLARLLGRDIRVSMYLGPPRANRKPVLHILSPAGAPVAFAKIGVNPLTRQLVHAEHDTLAHLQNARLPGITVPEVLHYGSWQDLQILVMSALPAWHKRQPFTAPQLATAMATVSQVDGVHSGPLATSSYLHQLRHRLTTAGDSPDQATLLWLISELSTRAGDQTLHYGAWHGDWAPWNMASTTGGLLVWDWERFTPGVPLGFDALHHHLQTEVGPGHRDPADAAAACVRNAPTLLTPFGVTPRPAHLTVLLYLTDLATRYLSDRQTEAGARLGTPSTWLIPALRHEVIRL